MALAQTPGPNLVQTDTIFPTINSTAAAAANSTAIQTALNGGGWVIVQCPTTGAVYLGSTIYMKSNTHLTMSQSCTPTGIAGTHSLLANYASSITNVPWTTTQLNTVITAGPLSIIYSGNTPAWSNNSGSGTAYAQGNYVTSNGNIYWESVATCTGSTTTGPSGTGTGITDGTCSWNYVTTDQQFTTGANITATVYWPSHGQVVGNAVALTPVPDTPASSNYWSGTQTAGTNGALADSAYFGTFPVTAVNDTNWITVALNRPPATAFSGAPMRIKQADENIIVDGGANWNYNSPTNTNTGSGVGNTTGMDIVMAWVENLTIDGVNMTNAVKYGLYVMGTNIDINHTISSNTQSDRIKIYGPSSSVTVENSYGPGGGDDIISLQPQDLSAFSSYILGCGDITEVTLRHITSDSGLVLAVYPTHQFLKMDDLLIDDFQIRNSVTKSYRGAVAIFGGATITTGEPLIGNLTIRRGQSMNGGGGMPLVSTTNGNNSSTAFQINNLLIDGGVSAFGQLNSTSIGQIFSTDVGGGSLSAGVIINKMTVTHVRSYVGPTGSTTDAAVSLTSGTFGEVDLDDSYVGAITKGNGFGVYLNGATVDHIGIHDNYLQDISGAARLFTASTVDLVGNHLAQSSVLMSGVVVNVTGTTENIDHNYASAITGGLVRVNGTFTQTVRSDGQNTLLSGSLLYVGASGSPVTTLLGGTDIAAINPLTVNSCGAGSTFGTGSNAVSGQITIPAATTTCTLNFPSNAYPVAPRGCIATQTAATPVATNCSIAWTNATTGTVSIYTAGGVTASYQILP